MPDPQSDPQIYDQQDIWLDAQGNSVRPGTAGATRHRITTYNDGHSEAEDWIPAQPTGGLFGIGQTQPGPNDGEWSESYEVPTPKDVSARIKQDSVDAKTTGISAPASQPFILRQNADGTTEQIPNPNYVGAQGQYITDSEGNQVWIPPHDLQPGQAGPMEPPRVVYQDPNADLVRQQAEADLAQKRQQMETSRLSMQKTQQDLQDPQLLAIQRQHDLVNTIQQQIASGQLQPDEGNRLMGLSRANLGAALQGTTPFQMQQEKQRQLEEQRNQAQSYLANQLRESTGMAGNLLSGLGGIYGKILGSTKPPALDPMAMAANFTQQQGGGPQLSQLARSLLGGAFQPPRQQGGGF